MAPIAMFFGVLLSVLGPILFALSDPEKNRMTAFIPSGFGVVLIVLGVLAINDKLRKHAMHAAAVVGLLGFLIPGYMVTAGLMRGDDYNLPKQGQTAMAVLCGVFLGLCVKSFIDARIARKNKGVETMEPLLTVPRDAEHGQRIAEKPFEQPDITPLAPTNKSAPKFKVFISYRRDDSRHITERIYDRLRSCFGPENVFKDVDSIPAGADFRKTLIDSISQCQLVLVVIGKQWLRSTEGSENRRLQNENDFVRLEIEQALNRKIPIIPILVDEAEMPSATDLPSTIQDLSLRNAISIRPDPDFHHGMDRLIKAMESLVSVK